MKFFAPLFLLILLSSNACMNGKTCSSEDKSCSFNEILYSYISVPPGIYMYSTQEYYQGNLAAYGSNLQLSLMNICSEARFFAQTISSCGNVLPFTSTDSSSMNTYVTDFSLDGTLPVRGARGELIFNTWNSIFASIPNLSMNQAGVTTEEFWTFSTGGSYSSSNCTNGVNFDNGDTGNIGDPNDTNLSWFSFGNRTCDQFKKVLCICY